MCWHSRIKYRTKIIFLKWSQKIWLWRRAVLYRRRQVQPDGLESHKVHRNRHRLEHTRQSCHRRELQACRKCGRCLPPECLESNSHIWRRVLQARVFIFSAISQYFYVVSCTPFENLKNEEKWGFRHRIGNRSWRRGRMREPDQRKCHWRLWRRKRRHSFQGNAKNDFRK